MARTDKEVGGDGGVATIIVACSRTTSVRHFTI